MQKREAKSNPTTPTFPLETFVVKPAVWRRNRQSWKRPYYQHTVLNLLRRKLAAKPSSLGEVVDLWRVNHRFESDWTPAIIPGVRVINICTSVLRGVMHEALFWIFFPRRFFRSRMLVRLVNKQGRFYVIYSWNCYLVSISLCGFAEVCAIVWYSKCIFSFWKFVRELIFFCGWYFCI